MPISILEPLETDVIKEDTMIIVNKAEKGK